MGLMWVKSRNDYIKALDAAVERHRDEGEALAHAEAAYKSELATQALHLKATGMPATMIDKVVYGMQDVRDKRLSRDIAEAHLKSTHELIQALKLELRLIEAQIERDWEQAKRT